MARSLMLSAVFDGGEEVIGLSPEELKAVASDIQSGRAYDFDPKVVSKVAKLHESAHAITPQRLFVDLGRWLLPPCALLAAMYWLIWRK